MISKRSSSTKAIVGKGLMNFDRDDRHPIRTQIKETLHRSKPLSAADIALICTMPVARIEYHVGVLEGPARSSEFAGTTGKKRWLISTEPPEAGGMGPSQGKKTGGLLCCSRRS
jgi:hypothetical protein